MERRTASGPLRLRDTLLASHWLTGLYAVLNVLSFMRSRGRGRVRTQVLWDTVHQCAERMQRRGAPLQPPRQRRLGGWYSLCTGGRCGHAGDAPGTRLASSR
jgi:hypothetical protein